MLKINLFFLLTLSIIGLVMTGFAKESNVMAKKDIAILREEARHLKAQSKTLYDVAEKLEKESIDLIKDAEGFGDDAEDLEDVAKDLLKEADQMQETIKTDNKNSEVNNSGGRIVSAEYIAQQELLLAKMRTNADELLKKARKISLKVREISELSDKKSEVSDKLKEHANKLDVKAEEIKEATDSIK